MGTTRTKGTAGQGRDAFFQSAKFLLGLLGFVAAPACVGMALRLFAHLTLRSSLIWATLSYPVIIMIGAIIGVSMLFSPPSGAASREGTQATAQETDADRQQDPFVG